MQFLHLKYSAKCNKRLLYYVRLVYSSQYNNLKVAQYVILKRKQALITTKALLALHIPGEACGLLESIFQPMVQTCEINCLSILCYFECEHLSWVAAAVPSRNRHHCLVIFSGHELMKQESPCFLGPKPSLSTMVVHRRMQHMKDNTSNAETILVISERKQVLTLS